MDPVTDPPLDSGGGHHGNGAGLALALRDNAAKGRPEYDYEYDRTERVVEALILIIIATVALLGNTSLWIIILRSKRLKTTSNYLILCLSTADLLVSAINMPVAVYTILAGEWDFSRGACVVLGLITMLTFCTSVMSLGAISINRYIMVCHPRRLSTWYTPRKTAAWIAGVWLFSFLIATPPLFGWAEYNYLPGQSFCFCKWTTSISYTFFMVGVCFGGPCTTMTFCYINILREVRSSKKRLARAQQRSSTPMRRGEGEPTGGTDTETELTSEPPNQGSAVMLNPKDSPKAKGPFAKLKGLFIKSDDKAVNNNGIKYTMNDINGLSSRPSSGGSPRRTPADDTAASVISNADPVKSAAKRRKEKQRAEEMRLTTSLFVVIITFVICWLPFCITMFISVFQTEPVPRIPDISTMLLGCFNSACNPIIYGLMNRKFRSGFAALYCWTCRRMRKQMTTQTSSSLPRSSSTH